jgi:hypothetical protein
MMRTDPHPEDVRELVRQTLEQLGAMPDDPGDLDETILIDRGRYMARSYRTEGYMAMWLIDVGIVQFYNEAGDMLATINLFETLLPQRMAA